MMSMVGVDSKKLENRLVGVQEKFGYRFGINTIRSDHHEHKCSEIGYPEKFITSS